MAASSSPEETHDSEQNASSDSSGHEEHKADTKIDSPPGTFTMADFAKYTKNNNKSATLKVDSLGITMNINYIDGEPYKDEKHETHDSDYLVGLVPEWNYDLHGADWPEIYPNCADQF